MRNLEKLVDIIEKLRGPNGCPWDREQTLQTLKPYLLEETYEVLEAMDEGGEKLKGELGDLLLQIVLQSSISKENGEFTIEDVIESISQKMIRRHPHVFKKRDSEIKTEEVLINWEKIKRKEKEHEERKSILDGVPSNFPALLRAEKLQKKASKVGFDWSKKEDVMIKLEEELEELKEEIKAKNSNKIEEELGDVFFTLVNLARHLKINPEICLNKASNKFEKRVRHIEKNCEIENTTLEIMNKFWDEVKKVEKEK